MFQRNPLKSPSVDLSAARDGRLTQPAQFIVDLSTARTDAAQNFLDIPIAGNSFYVDADPSAGVFTVEFQDSGSDGASPRLYCAPGTIFSFPFTRMKITNAAQSGKIAKIIYGTDMAFQPGSVAQLSASIPAANFYPPVHSGGFYQTGILALNTPEIVVAPASNVNGILILGASMSDTQATNNPLYSLLSKISAPANPSDGVIHAVSLSRSISASLVVGYEMNDIQSVPAGLGLYGICGVALSAQSVRAVRYKIL